MIRWASERENVDPDVDSPAGFGILSLASVCPIITVLAAGLIAGSK